MKQSHGSVQVKGQKVEVAQEVDMDNKYEIHLTSFCIHRTNKDCRDRVGLDQAYVSD
jgi:hypothetical protein